LREKFGLKPQEVLSKLGATSPACGSQTRGLRVGKMNSGKMNSGRGPLLRAGLAVVAGWLEHDPNPLAPDGTEPEKARRACSSSPAGVRPAFPRRSPVVRSASPERPALSCLLLTQG
jgi:hypothetical protein